MAMQRPRREREARLRWDAKASLMPSQSDASLLLLAALNWHAENVEALLRGAAEADQVNPGASPSC